MNKELKLARKIVRELQRRGINTAELPDTELVKWIDFFRKQNSTNRYL